MQLYLLFLSVRTVNEFINFLFVKKFLIGLFFLLSLVQMIGQDLHILDHTITAGFDLINVQNKQNITSIHDNSEINVKDNTIICGLVNYRIVENQTFQIHDLDIKPKHWCKVANSNSQNKPRKIRTKIAGIDVYCFNNPLNNYNQIKQIVITLVISQGKPKTHKSARVFDYSKAKMMLVGICKNQNNWQFLLKPAIANIPYTAFGNLPPPHLAV